jgi:tRNA delta(2)-isopentenylpyrophosphate transferase
MIGITELCKYLDKKITIEEAKELISIRTRQYAKRQITWSRNKMASWIKIEPNNFKTWLKN